MRKAGVITSRIRS